MSKVWSFQLSSCLLLESYGLWKALLWRVNILLNVAWFSYAALLVWAGIRSTACAVSSAGTSPRRTQTQTPRVWSAVTSWSWSAAAGRTLKTSSRPLKRSERSLCWESVDEILWVRYCEAICSVQCCIWYLTLHLFNLHILLVLCQHIYCWIYLLICHSLSDLCFHRLCLFSEVFCAGMKY